MAFTKAIRKLVRRFGYNVSMDQDAANLAVPGMRFRPFPALAGLDIIIADSKSEFEEMLVRATHSSIYDMELPILCAEDILLLKQRYVEHWRKKYEKHLADLHRLKEKLAAQTG